MIALDKPIEIYDDTGRGDSYEVCKILYDDEHVFLCNVQNEWYKTEFPVLVYRATGEVSARGLQFYYARNK